MKKIVVLLVLFSVCTFAFATEGRVNGMGVNPIFYNDDYLIKIFPQYLTQYMNYAYIDASHDVCYGTQYSGGLNFRLLGSNFGIYINKDFPVQFEYQYAKLEKAINIYIAKESFGLGLDIAMDHYNSNFEPPGESLVETTFGVGGKMGYEISGFDVSVQMHFATGISTHENIVEVKDNALIVRGAVRKKVLETDESVLYPAVTLEMKTMDETISYPVKALEEETTTLNALSIDPGIGLNHWLSKEVLIIAAASCGIFTVKYTDSETFTDKIHSSDGNCTRITLPKLELGLEAHLAKWLTVRAGIRKSYYYYSAKDDGMSKDDDLKLSYCDSYFAYNFGVGLEFGKFVIDWEICDDLLWNAPYIVTGNESDFASSLSLKYSFEQS